MQALPFLVEGIDQSCLIPRLDTLLFLWRAEGLLSPHYSLQREAETGSVERKDKEMNPLELCISINHSNTHKNTSAPLEKDARMHARTPHFTVIWVSPKWTRNEKLYPCHMPQNTLKAL